MFELIKNPAKTIITVKNTFNGRETKTGSTTMIVNEPTNIAAAGEGNP